MTIQEAIKSGKYFKRKKWNFYLHVDGYNIYDEKEQIFTLDTTDILADDWEVKEEWYEGDFKKKYPNGVLCWVWDICEEKVARVVNDYKQINEYPFIVYEMDRIVTFKYAKPVKPSEAPAIVGENDV